MTDTNTITITLPENYRFVSKVAKQDIVYDPAKMHESWLLRYLEKGMQRYANDLHSGYAKEDSQIKFDLCKAMAKESMSGNPAPEKVRGSGTASLPNDVALALKLARAALTIVFKKVTGKGRAIDFAAHEKVAPFFTVKDGVATWDNSTVQTWIDKQLADGKHDYLAEARASLDVDESDLDL